MPPGGQWCQLRARKPYPTWYHPPFGDSRKCHQPYLRQQLKGKRIRGKEKPHIFIVHGCQDGLADRGSVGVEPKEGKQPSGLRAWRLARGWWPSTMKPLT